VPRRGDTRREYDDNYEKLKAAELKSKCEELGIELTTIPIAGKQKNPIKADMLGLAASYVFCPLWAAVLCFPRAIYGIIWRRARSAVIGGG
jgi:hypothetical protein